MWDTDVCSRGGNTDKRAHVSVTALSSDIHPVSNHWQRAVISVIGWSGFSVHDCSCLVWLHAFEECTSDQENLFLKKKKHGCHLPVTWWHMTNCRSEDLMPFPGPAVLPALCMVYVSCPLQVPIMHSAHRSPSWNRWLQTCLAPGFPVSLCFFSVLMYPTRKHSVNWNNTGVNLLTQGRSQYMRDGTSAGQEQICRQSTKYWCVYKIVLCDDHLEQGECRRHLQPLMKTVRCGWRPWEN